MIVAIIAALGIAVMVVSGVSGNDTKNKTVIESTVGLNGGRYVMTDVISIPKEQARESLKNGKMEFAWGKFSAEANQSGILMQTRRIDSKYFDCKINQYEMGQNISVKCMERDEPRSSLELVTNMMEVQND